MSSTSRNKTEFSVLQISIIIFLLLCIIAICCTFILLFSSSPPPPIPETQLPLEQIIVLTANAAQSQTQAQVQAFHTPTIQQVGTNTFTPTVTYIPTGENFIFELQTIIALTEYITATPFPFPTIEYATYSNNPSSPSHPPGTSGLCNDGTYTSAQNKQGACSHHGGVAIWWGP